MPPYAHRQRRRRACCRRWLLELNGINAVCWSSAKLIRHPERADVAQLARKLQLAGLRRHHVGLRLSSDLPDLIALYDQILLGDAPPDAVVRIGANWSPVAASNGWNARATGSAFSSRRIPTAMIPATVTALLHTLATSLTPHLSPSAAALNGWNTLARRKPSQTPFWTRSI